MAPRARYSALDVRKFTCLKRPGVAIAVALRAVVGSDCCNASSGCCGNWKHAYELPPFHAPRPSVTERCAATHIYVR